MARKSAELLKSTPVKLGTLAKDFIKRIEKVTPAEGCEDQYRRYVTAVVKAEESCARYDALFERVEREGGTSSCKSYPSFMAAGDEYSRMARSAFSALDSYLYAAKHINDAKLTEEDELRDIIIASLSDKLDELQFTLNTGLLGSKVAHAVKHNVTEHTFEDMPLCDDDQEV